ncbi:MAG: hypothetical protein PHR10_05770 [Sphaerochaetaceae bacterium]|jgi:hypothetical protein|nr:hypothetical protein [Sphaerochaetaceae bacterium]MDD4219673.1 hypothetical protein [Sphaerochaetaceae bacterium]
MERQTIAMVRSGAIAVALSLILYRIAASSTLFIVPLLFFANKFRPKRLALIPVGVVFLILLGSQVVGLKELLREASGIGPLLVGLYLPVSLLIGTGIWIELDRMRMLVKLLASASFAAITGFILVLWFSSGSQAALATANIYEQMVEMVLPTLLGGQLPLGMSTQALFYAVVTVLKVGFLPIFIGQFGFSVLLSELLIHRSESTFQERMAHWKLPENSVWIFLGSWTIVLMTLLVEMPFLESVAWNTALTVSLLYMVQGISVVAAFMRRRNPRITSTRVFILSFLLALLPGVNLIPLLGLPLLGVSETWIDYRKNR